MQNLLKEFIEEGTELAFEDVLEQLYRHYTIVNIVSHRNIFPFTDVKFKCYCLNKYGITLESCNKFAIETVVIVFNKPFILSDIKQVKEFAISHGYEEAITTTKWDPHYCDPA